MKYELICHECGGKRFINRSSSYTINRAFHKSELVGVSKGVKNVTMECKKCKAEIEIKYYLMPGN